MEAALSREAWRRQKAILVELDERGLFDDLLLIARKFHVRPEDIIGTSRVQTIVDARHAFWLHLVEKGVSKQMIAAICLVHPRNVYYALAPNREAIEKHRTYVRERMRQKRAAKRKRNRR